MGKGINNGMRAVFCIVLVFSMLLAAVALNPQMNSLVEKAAQPMSLASNNWHDGNDQSTSDVDVTYSQQYLTITAGGSNMTEVGLLSQYMWLTYNDGSRARVGFEIHCVFDPGGLDVASQTILDWNKLNHIELILHSESFVNGTLIGTMYNFQGFDIVSGNAQDINLTKNFNSDGSYFYSLNNVVGCISYWGNAVKIGNVTLSTVDYTDQGKALKESIASFNITIASDMINLGLRATSPREVRIPVPTVLTFQVTHNATATEYKYGASVDWSEAKAFPTMSYSGTPALTSGQEYCLVAQDLLSFSYAASPDSYVMTQIKTFSTDANNDSAIYVLDGHEMCREQFTTQYTMAGSSQVHNTTRTYVQDAVQDRNGNVSAVFVVFDGFKYGESTGLAFDPAVITPNSIAPSTGPSSLTGLDPGLMVGLLLVAIAVIAIGAVVVVHRRRN